MKLILFRKFTKGALKTKYILLSFLGMILIVLIANIQPDIPLEELVARYTNEESKFIAIQGMNVHYRDEGTGHPLVLIHGTSSSLHTWNGWTTALKDKFRVIRMDIPAFGLTGPNANHDYSMNGYCAFLKEFLDALGVDSCYLAGNSLGGEIVWNFALRYPAIVKKAILIDAAGYSKHKTPFVIKLARSPLSSIFKNITPRFIVANSVYYVYGDDSKVSDLIIDRYYDLALREGNRGALIERLKNKRVPNHDKLSTIAIPVLVMWGEKDILTHPEVARQFHKDLPNSELIIYPGVGHVPMEEIPELTAQDARRFLLQ